MTLILSRLTLNINHRDVRRDLGDPYDLHRTLSRAFSDGPDAPVQRSLWRLEESQPSSPPILLVQSETEPNWGRLPDGYVTNIEQKSWIPESVLRAGSQIRLRCLANPTVCRVPNDPETQEQPIGPARGRRKRQGLYREADQLDWMQRQGNRLGIGQLQVAVSRSSRWRCRKRGTLMTVMVAQFDAEGVIEDPVPLAAGIRSGIGHARMLGLGLVSVAPLRRP